MEFNLYLIQWITMVLLLDILKILDELEAEAVSFDWSKLTSHFSNIQIVQKMELHIWVRVSIQPSLLDGKKSLKNKNKK